MLCRAFLRAIIVALAAVLAVCGSAQLAPTVPDNGRVPPRHAILQAYVAPEDAGAAVAGGMMYRIPREDIERSLGGTRLYSLPWPPEWEGGPAPTAPFYLPDGTPWPPGLRIRPPQWTPGGPAPAPPFRFEEYPSAPAGKAAPGTLILREPLAPGGQRLP